MSVENKESCGSVLPYCANLLWRAAQQALAMLTTALTSSSMHGTEQVTYVVLKNNNKKKQPWVAFQVLS